MRIKKIYAIILVTLFFNNFGIAQTDTSFYGSLMEHLNSCAIKEISSSFIINEMGDNVKVDTIKYYYHYGKYISKQNKTYYIYFNDEFYKTIKYYKNRLWMEDFYTQGINTKRNIYSRKRPYFMEKIVYFKEVRQGEIKRYKTEVYNKQGELIEERIYEVENKEYAAPDFDNASP